MKYPKFLKRNATIGVPAPSDGAGDALKKNRYENAVKFFKEKGYSLVLSDNLYQSTRGRSASARKRAEEINNMFERDDIDGILCAAGGDFLLEILPYINFDLIAKKEKLIGGFSDPTGILYPLTSKYDIATIYGNNFSSFGAEILQQNDLDFLSCIEGKATTFHSYEKYEEERVEKITGLEPNNFTKKVEWKTLDEKNTKIEGRILGGCFDIISELCGTKYDGIKEFNERYKEDGIIWFFDNCEITMEEVIRILWKMKELDYFKYAKGVIFGRFGVETTTYDYDVKTCLEDSILKDLNIPIIYDADISHKAPCIPIINGSYAIVECKDGKGTISFECK